jgi:hypothetical protein
MPRNVGNSVATKRRRPIRPFSTVELWQNGKYYAVAKRAGMCSGPWDTAGEAETVVRKWNGAAAN